VSGHPGNHGDFEAYRADIEAAERRVASEIDPGGRGLVVSIGVFVLLVSFLLPHTGAVRGWDVLFAANGSDEALVTLPSRLFMWLALVFGVGFSLLALLTRRWTVAWVALAGSAVASAAGLLAVWSRQTVALGLPGPGIGLILAWITVMVLTFHWARLVWSRTAVQLAAEEQRRRSTAQRQPRGLLGNPEDPKDPPAA
jgi:hypothetical protein